MMLTTQLQPTTNINLRNPFNFEPNETSRTPMSCIASPGENLWSAAFNYLNAIGSSRAFRIDSMLVNGKIEWYLRTFREPEIDSVRPEMDEINEDLYDLEREL